MKRIKNKSEEKDFFEKSLIPKLIESAIINGFITREDAKDPKTTREKLLKHFPKNDDDLYWVIDYSGDILNRVKQFLKEKDFNLVYVFIGTYFEHFINEVIQIQLSKKNISDKTIKEMLRNVSLESKFTWITEIIGIPKFNSKNFFLIKKISEKRNSYIHYKYTPQKAGSDIDDEKKEWKKISQEVKKVINYCKKYREKVIYNGLSKKNYYKN